MYGFHKYKVLLKEQFRLSFALQVPFRVDSHSYVWNKAQQEEEDA